MSKLFSSIFDLSPNFLKNNKQESRVLEVLSANEMMKNYTFCKPTGNVIFCFLPIDTGLNINFANKNIVKTVLEKAPSFVDRMPKSFGNNDKLRIDMFNSVFNYIEDEKIKNDGTAGLYIDEIVKTSIMFRVKILSYRPDSFIRYNELFPLKLRVQFKSDTINNYLIYPRFYVVSSNMERSSISIVNNGLSIKTDFDNFIIDTKMMKDDDSGIASVIMDNIMETFFLNLAGFERIISK